MQAIVFLFSASGFGGSFTSTNLLSLDAGLAWTNKLLLDGSMQVISLPIPRTYRVLISTNLTLPLSNWVALLTNLFDTNGNFTFTNSISPSIPNPLLPIVRPLSMFCFRVRPQ